MSNTDDSAEPRGAQAKRERDAAYWRAYRAAHRERILEREASYRAANPEQFAKRKAAYYAANREKMAKKFAADYAANRDKKLRYQAAYVAANRDKVAERQAAYRIANHAKLLEYGADYRDQNRESLNEAALEYHKANPQVARRNTAKRRAALNNPNWADQAEITRIYKECPPGYHVDHIIPLRGKHVCGLHVTWNLQYLLPEENMRKSNRIDPGDNASPAASHQPALPAAQYPQPSRY